MLEKIGQFNYLNKEIELSNNGTKINKSQNLQLSRNQYNEISFNAAKASKSYGLAQINKPGGGIVKQESLDFYTKLLKSEGKIEGKDFTIEKFPEYDNYNLNIYSHGNPVKKLYWCNGNGKEQFSGWDDIAYVNDRKFLEYYLDSKGAIKTISRYYYEGDLLPDAVKNSGLSYNCNPKNYINFLKSNNIKFNVEKYGEEDNNRWLNILTENKEGEIDNIATWYYGTNSYDSNPIFVSKSIYNDENKEIKRIIFAKDETEVVDYK